MQYYGVRPHGKEVPFGILWGQAPWKRSPFTPRSRPVGYAAEYLTSGTFAAIPMGLTLLMFMRILYHIW